MDDVSSVGALGNSEAHAVTGLPDNWVSPAIKRVFPRRTDLEAGHFGHAKRIHRNTGCRRRNIVKRIADDGTCDRFKAPGV